MNGFIVVEDVLVGQQSQRYKWDHDSHDSHDFMDSLD